MNGAVAGSMLNIPVQQCYPQVITRERYTELFAIAQRLCDFLDANGVSKPEGCQVRQLAEQLWNLPKKEEVKK